MNRAGDVVGYYWVGDPPAQRAFLFRTGEGKTYRIADDASAWQAAYGINDAGDVAVTTARGAFRWRAGTLTSIGTLPPGPNGPQTWATAIGVDGRVIGWGVDAGNAQRAIEWDGASLRPLGDAVTPLAEARSVNAAGIIVGVARFPGGERAAIFDGTTVRELGAFTVVTPQSRALAINDGGRVLGVSSAQRQVQVPGGWPPPVELHPFLFDLPEGPLTDISPDGACEGRALAPQGDVLGACYAGQRVCDHSGPCPPLTHASVWRDGTWTDLNLSVGDTTWTLEAAYSVNASGQIAGIGTHGGSPGAFLLTPR